MKNLENDNRQDIGRLVSENESRLKNFIRKRVSNKDDADDILQDVFYQLVKTVENTLTPIEQVTAWLYRVARNTIINRGKKKTEEAFPSYQNEEGDDVLQEFAEILFSDESASPDTEYIRSLVWDELELALAELPPEQREVFELTELEGLSIKEVSEVTGVQTNTLLSRKHYAVKHLRLRMRQLYDDLLND